MHRRFFVPIIALILLRIGLELAFTAKAVRADFEGSYEVLRCARREVYERNIQDAVLYLKKLNPNLEAEADDFLQGGPARCEAGPFDVYRETNERLELLYPNWSFLETVPDVGER